MPISNINDLSLHRVVGRGGTAPTAEWTYDRPSEWPAIAADIGVSDQKMVGLYQVDDSNVEFCSIMASTSSGTYSVDWGDGTSSTGIASSTRADHTYTYSDVDLTTTTYGYKVAKITLTPDSANITSVDFKQKNSAQQPYGTIMTKWLDIDMRFPSMTTLSVSSATYLSLVQKFRLRASAITSIQNTFDTCTSLQWVEELTTTGSLTGAASAFNNCFSLVKIPAISLSSVANTSYMFYACYNLLNVPTMDLSSSTNMQQMFWSCSSLTKIETMTFNTTSNTNANNMFNNCFSLASIPANLNFSKITNAGNMFSYCQSLTSVPTTINLEICTNMSSMFYFCVLLKEVTNLTFNTTTNVTANSMFYGCTALKAVPTNLDFVKITTCYNFFYGCNSLETIPTSITLSISTSVYDFFKDCYSLKEIPAITLNASSGTIGNMFVNCKSLVKLPSGMIFTGIPVNNVMALNNLFSLTSIASATWKAQVGINLSGCKLDSVALNAIYTDLPTAAGTITYTTINITQNPGASTDDPTIATAKGWTVTG